MNSVHTVNVERPPGKTPSSRLDFVDALRGWAILGVLTVHTAMFAEGDLPSWFRRVTAEGARGVQLFYVVSAFTLFLSMARRKAESASVRNFFVRRFFRIAPMFWVAMVFYLWRDGLEPHYSLGDAPGISAWNILATTLFVNGWNPYWINSIVPGGWSVAIEMMFYLTLPFLARRIRSLPHSLWFFSLTMIGSLALHQVMIRLGPVGGAELWRDFLFMWLPAQAPIFALGIVLYFLWQKVDSFDEALGPWLIASSVFLCGSACFGGYLFFPGHVVFAIAFVMLALGLAMRPIGVFVNSLTRSLGEISYSFYLTHIPMLGLCAMAIHKTGVNGMYQYWILWLAGGVGSFVAASVCYRFVEKPGMEFGQRLIERLGS